MYPWYPWHLGALHPIEQALTIVLAFGPFVVLGIVLAVRRRSEDAAGDPDAAEPPAADGADPHADADDVSD